MASTALVGGRDAKAGFYWNLREWKVTVADDDGPLPGSAEDRYLRVPTLVMLLLAPVMGGLFVMFLPLIGFAMVLQLLARKAAVGARDAAASLASVMTGQWRPGEAYLEGKPGKKEGEASAAAEKRIEALEKEVDDKRGK